MIEKKLKHSAEKITMPDGLKERILEKCDSTETAKNEADEEITFTVEPFRPHRIRRIVSVAAAVAVITGIAGYSGYLISRNGTPMGTETSTEITTKVTENEDIIIPFANLNGKMIHFNGYRGILQSCVLDEMQSQKLSEFFSTVEWQSIPADSPDTLATSPGVADTNDMNFYYCDSEDNILEYLTVTLDGSCAVSHSVNEYDENGQFVSGHMYYYKIDETAFRDSIISLLYGDSDLAPPFDISAVNAYKSELDNRHFLEYETAMITDAFYGWNWSNEIDTLPENEPAYVFTDGDSLEIAVYEDDTVTVQSNNEYHCYSNVSGNGGTLCMYLKIMLKEESSVYTNDFLPFGDFAIKEYSFDGEVIPVKKRFEIADFFNRQVWKMLDSPRGDYMGGIAYNFIGKDSITIYREGILEYNDENGSVSQYEIDFDLFNLNIGSILYGDEFANSEAPLSELDGNTMIFSGFRNFISSSELDETKSQQMSDFFRSINWQEIEPPVIKDRLYPAIDSIIFSTYEGNSTYRLTFSMNGTNLATYTVYDKIPAGDDDPTDVNIIEKTKYFAIDENVIREAVAMYLADGGNLYAPFGTLYKMTDSIYCESETYTGSLTEDKIKGISYAFLGWDWSDVSDTVPDGEPEYIFKNGGFTISVYADGTVVWNGKESYYESPVYRCYNNVDGNDDPNETTGNLCLMINDVLMEYIKVS